jgi:hypothetical protein
MRDQRNEWRLEFEAGIHHRFRQYQLQFKRANEVPWFDNILFEGELIEKLGVI